MFQNSYYQIDLNAPIVPGHSAAGFTIGMMIRDIDAEVLGSFRFTEKINKYISDLPPLHEYSTDDIILYFNRDKLTQIGLMGNYKGKLETNLGLGDMVRDFEKKHGAMKQGGEDELSFANLKGLCFEVDYSKYNSGNWKTAIPNLPVTEIYIFDE